MTGPSRAIGMGVRWWMGVCDGDLPSRNESAKLEQLVFEHGGGDAILPLASDGIEVEEDALVPPPAQAIDQRRAPLWFDGLAYGAFQRGLHGYCGRRTVDYVNPVHECPTGSGIESEKRGVVVRVGAAGRLACCSVQGVKRGLDIAFVAGTQPCCRASRVGCR